MNEPTVFVSCVSPEFRRTRSRVAAILTRLGHTPIFAEIFGTEDVGIRQVLRDKIDACEGLIQIVGQGYGADSPIVSYTLFELLYAFAGDACIRDRLLECLDVSYPVGYQIERRALQLTDRNKRRSDCHLYYDAEA
jgi:hypothetical protein